MKRDEFFARVRSAVQSAQRFHIHTRHDIPAGAGYVGGGDDLPERLAREILAVGGFAHLVDDLPAARAKVSELLAAIDPRSAICWRHPLLDRLGLAELLAARNTTRLDYDALSSLPEAEVRPTLLSAGVGLTSCNWAIAETGTLVMLSKPGHERLASLLPPVHVAVVEAGQILPDLFDLFTQLHAVGLENLPSNLTLITGPSKTGDIELQLTTGVHGPGAWHVVIVRA